MKKLLSFVVPVYNEERNIPVLYEKLQTVMTAVSEKYDSEIILVNDGSRDNSWQVIKKIAEFDDRIVGITFSRNFGHQMALTAGYDHAQGDAVIALDADLQDPPELIYQMIAQWQQGFYIVYARRSSRADGFLKKITANIYYKLLYKVADVVIPQNVGDFRLIDKRVLYHINACRERARYLRGMVAWTGFKHTFVDFERGNRLLGETGYSWSKLFSLAFDGLTNFSLFPLKIAAFMGLLVIAVGSCMFMYVTYDILFNNAHYPPFKWLLTSLYVFTGIQFILMWLLGEYVGRIYEQLKNRPLYIIEASIRHKTFSLVSEITQPLGKIHEHQA